MTEKRRIKGVLSLDGRSAAPKTSPTPESALRKGETRIGEPYKNETGDVACNAMLRTKNSGRTVEFIFVWNPEKGEAEQIHPGAQTVHLDLFRRVRAEVIQKIRAFLRDSQ